MYNRRAVLPDSEIRAMQGAAISLGIKGIPVTCLSPDKNCLSFRSKLVQEKLTAPSSKEGNLFIEHLINKVPLGILFPSNDRCALLIAQHAYRLREAGFLFNVPQYETLISGFDKWKVNQNATQLGISCAKSFLISDQADIYRHMTEVGFPFIVKATRLAGGNYIKINKESDVEQAYQNLCATINLPENVLLHPEIMIQEWLTYEMEDIWCSESYYSLKGDSVGTLTIRKDRTVVYGDGSYGSRLYAGECVHEPELADLTNKLLNGLNWRGFAHIDWVYMRKERKFFLMEINPRLPGFSVLPFRAGFDMAYYYYNDLNGGRNDCSDIRACTYFEMLRYPGDISGTIKQIIKGKYSLKRFIGTYARALISKKKICVDYFCREDLKTSFINIYTIFLEVLRDLVATKGFKRKIQ